MRGSNFPTPRTADEYIAQQPMGFRATLEKLRSIIQTTVPQAIESISYPVISIFICWLALARIKSIAAFIQ
jgi:hypothetical protein